MLIKNLPKIEGTIGWKATSPFTESLGHGPLINDQQCDYAIIGAGYSGLSLAHRLAQLQPDARITVLDALDIAEGAAGRNAGFIIDVPHNLNPKQPNLEQDLMQLRLNQFAIARLEQFNQQHGIDVCWQKIGKYLAAHHLKNEARLTCFEGSLKLIQAPYEVLDKAALRDRLGTDYYQKAIFTPNAILMNPAALIQGIARILPPSVTLHTHSPVIELQQTDQSVQLHTAQGSVTAKHVILGANAFTESFGYLKDKLIPVFTYASLTRPLTVAQREKIGHPSAWGVTAAHSAGSTVRYTPDHRLFMRNCFDFTQRLATHEAHIARAQVQHLNSLCARFPDLFDQNSDAIEYSWGGMICVTRNQQPFFGKLGSRLYALAGMNGVGVAKGTYLGYYMADYLSGIDSPELNFILQQRPTWVPPEPLRTIGVKARFVWEVRQAAGEV